MKEQTNVNLHGYIVACIQRALQGQVPAVLRECSFSFDEEAKHITLKLEVERTMTEEEIERIAVAETQIYGDSIFGDDTRIETLVKVVPKGESLRPLPGGIAFSREEGHVPHAD